MLRELQSFYRRQYRKTNDHLNYIFAAAILYDSLPEVYEDEEGDKGGGPSASRS